MKKRKKLIIIVIVILVIGLVRCGSSGGKKEPEPQKTIEVEETKELKEIEEVEEVEDVQTETHVGIDPAFKEVMDTYEEFTYEYVEFMKKYENASEDQMMDMLADYTQYMGRYVEVMENIDEINEDDLNVEEAVYYYEVSSRIMKKLAELQ